MNENIMNNEEIMVDVIEEASVATGSAGKYIAIGSLVVVGAVALYKGGKVLVEKYKARKEQRKAKDEDCMVVDEKDLVDHEEE